MSIRFVAASLCVIVVSCGPRPVELGFWLERGVVFVAKNRRLTVGGDLKTIDAIARLEIEHAFERFDVTVTTNHNARYRVSRRFRS